MSRRHRGPYDVVPASALDVTERPRRPDAELQPDDAETQPEIPSVAPPIPDIAPPRLLDPIPPPTVLELRTAAPTDPEPVVHDAYALAAAAAHQMEREGRAFDTADAQAQAWPDEVDPEPPTEEAPLDTDGADDDWATPAPASRPNQGLRVAVAALVFLFTTLVLIVSLFLLLRPFDPNADILRPVPESVGNATTQRRFAVPPSNLPAPPPGSAVGFDPRGAPSAQRAAVRFDSDPTGAAVRVDGRVLGRTPLELSLPYGTYATEFLLEGHAAVRQPVEIGEPSVTVSVPLVRDQAWGRVDVLAPGWEGAILYIDGEEYGRMPTSVVLQPGVHTFALERDEARLEVRRKVWVTREAPVVVDLTK